MNFSRVTYIYIYIIFIYTIKICYTISFLEVREIIHPPIVFINTIYKYKRDSKIPRFDINGSHRFNYQVLIIRY